MSGRSHPSSSGEIIIFLTLTSGDKERGKGGGSARLLKRHSSLSPERRSGQVMSCPPVTTKNMPQTRIERDAPYPFLPSLSFSISPSLSPHSRLWAGLAWPCNWITCGAPPFPFSPHLNPPLACNNGTDAPLVFLFTTLLKVCPPPSPTGGKRRETFLVRQVFRFSSHGPPMASPDLVHRKRLVFLASTKCTLLAVCMSM